MSSKYITLALVVALMLSSVAATSLRSERRKTSRQQPLNPNEPSETPCPVNAAGQFCYGNGACNNGTCSCNAGFKGEDCRQKVCPQNCNNRGTCDSNGVCSCVKDYGGPACTDMIGCQKNCSSTATEARGSCSQGVCRCKQGFSGAFCEKTKCPTDDEELGACSGHGVCNNITLKCDCLSGFLPPKCTPEQTCAGGCQNGGTCMDGSCSCAPAWTGPNCELRACGEKDACSGHGECEKAVRNTCICTSGFSGPLCDIPGCPSAVAGSKCSGHGICNAGQCTCKCEGAECYTGAACDRLNCPRSPLPKFGDVDCSGHGSCAYGVPPPSASSGDALSGNITVPGVNMSAPRLHCSCSNGYVGEACDQKECPADAKRVPCAGHGVCMRESGDCECQRGWMGPMCSQSVCSKAVGAGGKICSGRGSCIESGPRSGKCTCEPGFKGDYCGEKECPQPCQNGGKCENGGCFCVHPWYGQACTQKPCIKNCSYHGSCMQGSCKCRAGWRGEACEFRVCPGDCSNHGTCNTTSGKCSCFIGWTDKACGSPDCPRTRQGRCNNKGSCDFTTGRCSCVPGWEGDVCVSRSCPSAPSPVSGSVAQCAGLGACKNGTCVCKNGFMGTACETPYCGKNANCTGHGKCSSKVCGCDKGWAGEVCDVRICDPKCNAEGGVCVNGNCDCKLGYEDASCNTTYCGPAAGCSGHGQCTKNATLGKMYGSKVGGCKCNAGWSGRVCEVPPPNYPPVCPNCNLGKCVIKNGKAFCVCPANVTGEFCDTFLCPGNCNRQGECVNGTCFCRAGFTGPTCSQRTCDNDCSAHGICNNGVCVCRSGWGGSDCAISTSPCPNACSGNGRCVKGACVCMPGFDGADCSKFGAARCPLGAAADGSQTLCSGRGACDEIGGTCKCVKGWRGPACDMKSCPRDCSSHGSCSPEGVCTCMPGYNGLDCSALDLTCANNCSGRGICKEGVCFCRAGSVGKDCSKNICLQPCQHNGTCVNGKCECATGWTGEYCAIKVYTCPGSDAVSGMECSGHGECDVFTGNCTCEDPWLGQGCNMMPCLNECNGRGTCNNGTCACGAKWKGDQCEIRTCKNGCSGHGKCLHDGTPSAVCSCATNWESEDCSDNQDCPRNSGTGEKCSNSGKCIDGNCFCLPGFTGPECGTKLCSPVDCSGHGRCVDGGCKCRRGWLGKGCDVFQGCAESACSSHGKCDSAGTCQCEWGWCDVDCSRPVNGSSMLCPNMCSGHGMCKVPSPRAMLSRSTAAKWVWKGGHFFLHGRCECEDGFAGADCSKLACPNGGTAYNCSGHGACVTPSGNSSSSDASMIQPVCACMQGWQGEACSVKPCAQGCVNGKCNLADGTCSCSLGWAGSNCTKELCPNECSKPLEQGVCRVGVGCVCVEGFAGLDCSKDIRPKIPAPKPKPPPKVVLPCVDNCNGHGSCNNGTCVCAAPYSGPTCSVRPLSLEECGMCCGIECTASCKPKVANQEAEMTECVPECNNKCMAKCLPNEDHAQIKTCRKHMSSALSNSKDLPQSLNYLAHTLSDRFDAEEKEQSAAVSTAAVKSSF